ncbi:hypothetical protein [Methanobrevibacter filiformis]|uniref:Uncharacterized protein n=1 Tax=Methanobrevibacter filiformis TaxID=55758 RepID=A0A165YUC6_9EURY|nr:hypothetical protein [Methanobrevibacter filiformis]KZX09876.1 hypothetical protein MBFIL_19510 [Methanobrevibacter filiformis]
MQKLPVGRLEDMPDECKPFYAEMDKLLESVEAGNYIELDVDAHAKKHKHRTLNIKFYLK